MSTRIAWLGSKERQQGRWNGPEFVNVRYWRKAAIGLLEPNVRFGG
jgi:hypothetical protein